MPSKSEPRSSGSLHLANIFLTFSFFSTSLPIPESDLTQSTHAFYDTSRPLDPWGVYGSVVNLMAVMVLWRYDEKLGFVGADWTGYGNMMNSFHPWLCEYDLKPKHIIPALTDTIAEIDTKSRFCETLSVISLGRAGSTIRYDLGALRFVPRPAAPSPPSASTNASLQSSDISYPSGRWDDDVIGDLSIDYTYSGTLIASTDIFYTFINALAAIAPYSDSQPFHSFQAASRSGQCEISIVATGQHDINYNFIKKALGIPVRDIILVLLKFGEMTLGLNAGADKVAEMTIRRTDRGAIAQS